MAFNQEQLKRITAATVAAALPEAFRAGEVVFIIDTGLWYSVGTSGEIALDNGLFLTASTQVDLADHTNAYQPILNEIVTRDSIGAGATMTKPQADELVRRTLGIDAFWRDTNGRLMPLVSPSGAGSFIWRNSTGDETGDLGVMELVLPADSVRGKALQARFARASSSGTREFRVYDGDPTASGTIIDPTLGTDEGISGQLTTTVWDLERPLGAANDIHIVIQREGIYDLQLAPNAPYRASDIRTSTFGEAAVRIFQETGIGNGGALNHSADDMVAGLGIGASFMTTGGRQRPVMFGNGTGFFANTFGDETQPTATVCQLVIPQSRLAHNQILEIQFGQVTTGGADRDVFVYAGNPIGGGIKLTPVVGSETHGNTDRTFWNVSTAPGAGTPVTADLHIVFNRVTVTDVAIHTQLPISASDPEMVEVRGGARPAQHSITQAYSAGDEVYVAANDRSYKAKGDLAAGAFVAADWDELSVNNNSDRLDFFDDEQIEQNDQIERLRGADVYPDYDPASSTPYTEGTILHDTGTGRNYRAKVDIPANNGTFDDTDTATWDVVHVQGNNDPIMIRNRLSELTSMDRLDSDVIKFNVSMSTIWVSETGTDTNDGRSEHYPVRTIAQAIIYAIALGNVPTRVIKCHDASAFTEDIVLTEPMDIYMPHATITGNVSNTTPARCAVEIGTVIGNVTVDNGSHYKLGRLQGNLTIGDGAIATPSIYIQDYLNGTFDQALASGSPDIQIVHDTAGVVLTPSLGYTPTGQIGSATYSSGESIRDRLHSLTGDERLDSDAIKFHRGQAVVFVSETGDDANNGRSISQPVRTLAQATVLASALGVRSIISCEDASSFTEDYVDTADIELYLPNALLTGNITGTPSGVQFHQIGRLIGDVTVTTGDHYIIRSLSGNVTLDNLTTDRATLDIVNFNTGSIIAGPSIAGNMRIAIEHNLANATVPVAAGFNPIGFIGDSLLGLDQGDTPTGIRDALETLTGDDRLDAAFIKGITAGGGGHAQLVATVTPNDNWINLYMWDSTSSTSEYSDRVLLRGTRVSDGATLFTSAVYAAGSRSNRTDEDAHFLRVYDRQSSYDATAEYRLIFETDTDDSNVILQFKSGVTEAVEFTVTDASPTPSATGETLGDLAIWSGTGEMVMHQMDVTNWQSQGVHSGSTGGIITDNIGDPNVKKSWIDFTQNSVDLHAEEVTIGKFSSTGTRLSAGEYGSWIAPTSTDWPIDATSWTDLIAQKRTTVDDTSLNPSSTITWSAVDIGGTNAATMTGFDAAHRGLRFTTATGTRGLQMNFADCLFQRLTLTFTFGVATTAGGATQDYELLDDAGTVLTTFQTPGTSNAGDVYTFAYDLSTGSGATQVVLRKASTGTSQAVYLFNYGLTVNVDEPALEPLVVVQQDSPLRGTLLPRIIPQSTGHPQGSLALNGLAENRPIWYDGDDWAYLNTTRIDFRSVDTGQFFFAEGGTFADAGWTGSNQQRLVVTENHQGFPQLVRCTQSGGTITMQAPNNTQALWDTARANGFRVDYRMMFNTGHDGAIWMDIEPNNTSWGSNGRFEANVSVSAGQLQLTMINSGGNTTFDLDFDIMHTISMICPPNSNTAEMHIEGVKVGEITYGGGGTTDRGTFFFIPPGNAANDFCIQSITTYTVGAAERDVTLDRKSITTGLRYNVPNINSPMVLRVPKGLYDFGNTFTIVNGSTETCIAQGLDDDHQLFGGVSQYEVSPQKEVTFTQTGFPRGNVWAVEGGKTIINHNENTSTGNSLILTVSSSGTVLGRHGNYVGDVSVTRPSTGQFLISAGTTVWGNDMAILATPTSTTAKEITAGTGGLGAAYVNTYDAAGNAVSDAFYAAIYW